MSRLAADKDLLIVRVAELYYEAVSYTHLDVYKRQPVIRALQHSDAFYPIVISTGQHEELVAELFREAGMRIDATLHASRREDGVVPSLNEMVARIIVGIDRLWACLLYTSRCV